MYERLARATAANIKIMMLNRATLAVLDTHSSHLRQNPMHGRKELREVNMLTDITCVLKRQMRNV